VIQQAGEVQEEIGLRARRGGNDLLHIRIKINREFAAARPGKVEQALFAGMQEAIDSKENIKIAGEERSQAMIEADKILTLDCFFNLVEVGRDDLAQNRMIIGDDVGTQRLRVRLLAEGLKRRKPALRIMQALRVTAGVPEASGVAQAGLVIENYPVDLLLHPIGIKIYQVHLDAGSSIKPFIARAPVGEAQVGCCGTARLRQD